MENVKFVNRFKALAKKELIVIKNEVAIIWRDFNLCQIVETSAPSILQVLEARWNSEFLDMYIT